ncbi:MAG: alanine racemase [Myxococcota bacterium]
MGFPCQATIDLRALRANLGLARELAGRREVIAVVKADGYGHGAVTVAKCLLEAGCTRLAVLTVPEGAALREAGVGAGVLVLAGARNDEEARAAVSLRLTPVLHDPEGASRLESAAAAADGSLPVHVEIDTGMHRMGVPSQAAVAFLKRVHGSAQLELEGVFTHLACADEPDLQPSLEQIERFRAVLQEARENGIDPALIHADNSAALMCGSPLCDALPEATAVRPGLMLYGVRPAPHLEGKLQPVMTLRASVLAVHDVEAGRGVGYGASWCAPASGTRVATLSVGYADGVPWTTANRGHVWLGGARRPIVGRVSMDSVAVDLGDDSRVSVGDEAVFFGALDDAPETPSLMSVEAAAQDAGTLHYELLVRVGARVPRVVVD